jgi:ABC-type multidrug transport system permease subunit
MKRILDIGRNDLRLFFKHRKSAYVWLFVVPLLFVYFMGFTNRGPGDPYNRRPPVLIENEDTNFLSKIFLDELGAQNMRLIDPTNRESAARAIRIPADFTARVLRQEQVKVNFSERNNSAEADAALIELRVVRALISLNGHILEAVSRGGSTVPLTEAQLRAVMQKPDPVKLKAEFAGRNPAPSGYSFSLPGNLVMYLMMNLLIFGGSMLAADRRNGVIKRLLVHPITRAELVLGKIFGLMLLGLVQIVFFMIVGRLFFKVNFGSNVPAVLLTLTVFAWVAASLGVLLGSVLSSQDRVIGVCVLVSLLMGAVGGSWWPLEVAPPGARLAALCVPNGWALKALHQLITFGNNFSGILVPLAVLLGFGAVFNLLAMKFFRS